jgi:acetate kinase
MFTAGIGENSPMARQKASSGLERSGVIPGGEGLSATRTRR